MNIASAFKFVGRTIFSIIRMFFVGIIAAVFCIYTVDYLLDSKFGTFNIVITTVYFSLICIFAVLFVELFTYFQRKSKRKNRKTKDEAQYSLK